MAELNAVRLDSVYNI